MNPIRTSRWAALALSAALLGCDDSTPSKESAPPAPNNPAPGKPSDTKPAVDVKPPADMKPADTKPADVKPAAKSTEASPPKKLDIAGAKLNDKELAAVNKLDEADRKVALEQKLCPVSGAHLGAMGKPVKVTLKDKAVFLCCDSCEDDAKAKPDEALARLKP